MKTKLFILACSVALLSACSNKQAEENETVSADPKTELLNEIKTIEDELFANPNAELSKVKANELIQLYKGYVDNNREDANAAEYLFKAGEVAEGLEKHDVAIAFFNRVVKEYPEYTKRPEALYLTGFINETKLQKYGEAKTIYEQVIQEFPNHILAKNATHAIENLGMSDEELIQKFEAMNAKK